jgi:hypothetical protein
VIRFALDQPGRFISVAFHKLKRFIDGNEVPRDHDLYFTRRWSPLLWPTLWKVPMMAFPWGLLFPLSVVGLGVASRRAKLIATLVVALALGVVVFFVTARYRVPLVPFFALFAVESVRWFVRDAAVGGRIIAASAAAALLALSNLGQGRMPEQMNADALYALAVDEADRGSLDDAVALLKEAVALDPQYADAWTNLGIYLHRLDQLEAADAAYARAVSIDPMNVAGLMSWAALCTRTGRLNQAIKLYEGVLRQRPSLQDARRNLEILQSSRER